VSQEYRIFLNEKVEAHLKALLATGLFGDTLHSVIERLICRQLEAAARDGWIKIR